MWTQRLRQPEVMDDPDLAASEHRSALRGLQRIHRLTGTIGHLWHPIARSMRAGHSRELSLLDVGCGDGWIMRQLWRLARRRGCQLRLHACDFSSRALDLCGQACRAEDIPVELHQVDITRDRLPITADIVINSLFLHHFSDEQVVELLRQFQQAAKRLLVVEDLLRTPLGYGLCWLGVHAVTRSRVVHTDGPLSVRAAFTLPEMRALLEAAGLSTARVRRCWPERVLITQECQHAGRESRSA